MPVLGYDTAGESSSGNNTYYYGNIDVADALGGTIKSFHCAIAQLDGSLKDIKIAVANCNQSTGDPSSKSVIEQVEYEVEVSDDNEAAASFSEVLNADTKYYIAIIPEGAGTKYKYDSPGLDSWYKAPVTYADQFPNPLQSGILKHGFTASWSVWIDYQHPGVLGYDTAGTSKMGNSTIVYGGGWSTDGIGGFIQAFHVAIGQVYAPLDAIKIVVADCKQDDGDPSGKDVIEQIEIHPVIVNDDNVAAAVGSNNLEADTKYYIGILSASGATKWKYDSGVGVTLWHDALAGVDYATWFPDPCRTPYSSSGLYSFSVWVDYEPPPPPVANPVFDPAEGDYIDYVDVTITCETGEATIKYTTDGSEPAQDHGTEYTVPIRISTTTTLKAIAYKDGLDDSDVVSGLYTIKELWREIIEFNSPITKEIEFESPICLEIEFESPITLEIEFDSEVDHG